MKFAEHLSAHITPEWRKQYINYEEMKAMLYMAVEESPSAESVEPEVVARHFANFDEQFFHYCDKELKKINTFYAEKLAEATRKFANLNSELIDSVKHMNMGKKKTGKRNIPVRKMQELKLAFSEFYLSLILLQNYQTLNHVGFRKILKKHDKLLTTDVGAKWRQEQVETSHFFTNKDIDQMIADTENTVTNELEAGDRQKAMKKLRVPPLGEQQSPWTTFKVGLFSGSFIVLLITVVLSAIFHEGSSENLKIAFRLYRGPLLIIEFLFLIGVNVYGWRSSGVNHVLIFELDPRNHLSEQHLMELAAIFGVVWALSLLNFLYSDGLSIPPYVNPAVLVFVMILFLVNPLKVFRHDARFWFIRICAVQILFYLSLAPSSVLLTLNELWSICNKQKIHATSIASIGYVLIAALTHMQAIFVSCFKGSAAVHVDLIDVRQTNCKVFGWRVINHYANEVSAYQTEWSGRMFGAPFFHVGFADFWLADQLNSLVNALLDFQFLTCFYFTNGSWFEARSSSECMERNFIIRPLVNCIPAWIRFAQCLRRYYDTKEAFPHLVNAGKYSTTFLVVIFATLKSVYKDDYANSSENPFVFLWIASQIVSSSYAYTWDIKMDWGLFDKSAGENTFLREEIVYTSTFYYFAIIEDFVLRFAWSISLYLTEYGYVSGDIMTSILSPLEVFRRFVWNFFRLENEHLNNCGKFRAVRDISVAPIDSSDQTQILRMMDEEDGVVNRERGKRKTNKKKEDKRPLLHDESIITFKAIPMSTIQA